jgi:hypothetical protein
MKTLQIIASAMGGIALGAAAFAACSVTSQMQPYPHPCHNIEKTACPSDCTPTIDYSGTRYSDCSMVASGCCQWMVETFKCSGGSCGSGCSWITAPHVFSKYEYPATAWECKPYGVSPNRVCMVVVPPDPPGGGD